MMHGTATAASLELAYQQPACAAARRFERSRFASLWQTLLTRMRSAASLHATHEHVAISKALRAAYVYNPKAAHQSVQAMFERASRQRLKTTPLPLAVEVYNRSDASKLLDEVDVVFTFVRDPVSTFLSGYAEAVHRRDGAWGSARSAVGPNTTFGTVDCNGSDANATRFAAFLEDVLRCRRLNYDAYHVWPQVVKLDVLPDGRSFDFIGRVEHLRDDMDRLLRLLGVNRSSAVAGINPASHNQDRCGRQIGVPDRARRAALPLLCDLLRADFICFGYAPPPECRRTAEPSADGSSGQSDAADAQADSQAEPSTTCSVSASQRAALTRVRANAPAADDVRSVARDDDADPAQGAPPPPSPSGEGRDDGKSRRGWQETTRGEWEQHETAAAAAAAAAPHAGCAHGTVRLHSSACFQTAQMDVGALAFADRPYPIERVPPVLSRSLFFGAPHRLAGPDELRLTFEAAERASVWVYWNNRSGHGGLTDLLPALGFVRAGSGPVYANGKAACAGSPQPPGCSGGVLTQQSDLWVLQRVPLAASGLASLTLRIPPHRTLTMGVLVTGVSCGGSVCGSASSRMVSLKETCPCPC